VAAGVVMIVDEAWEVTEVVPEIGVLNAIRVGISLETAGRLTVVTNVTKWATLLGIVPNQGTIVEVEVTQMVVTIVTNKGISLETVHPPRAQLLATLVAKLVIWLGTATVMTARAEMMIRERERAKREKGLDERNCCRVE